MAIYYIISMFAYIRHHYLPYSFNPMTWGHNNFGVVHPERLYRSKTIGPKSLEEIIKKHTIQKILIVREYDTKARWLQDEARIAQAHNVPIHSLPMIARHAPSREQLTQLYHLFTSDAQRLLIHCQAGADRTGFVCAFWKLCQGHSLDNALQQLSMRYGHFSFRYPKLKKTIEHLHSLVQTHGDIESALEQYDGQKIS